MRNRPGARTRTTPGDTRAGAVTDTPAPWLGALALSLLLGGLLLVVPLTATLRAFWFGFLAAAVVACLVGCLSSLTRGERRRSAARRNATRRRVVAEPQGEPEPPVQAEPQGEPEPPVQAEPQGKPEPRSTRMQRRGRHPRTRTERSSPRRRLMARHRDTERLAVEATAEVLATGRRRRSGWKLVSGRHVAELGGIDQVLVGPGGIFAVWSTWPSGRCSVEDGVVTGAVDPEPIARARQGARAVERWMHTGPLGLDAEVRPVVVMWGPGRIRFAEGWDRIDGVLVCDGQLDLTWLPELDATHLDQSRINDIADALADLSPRQVPSSVATEVPLVLSSRS